MITDLDKLSDALDNSTFSRKLVTKVTRQKDQIAEDIKKNGFFELNVGGRRYRVVTTKKKAAAATK